MFQKPLDKALKNINTIRLVLQTNKKLRIILSKTTNPELVVLQENAPKFDDWEEYENCSVVTRLYAIYESFVENLITEWIRNLPSLFSKYSDLSERIKTTHQEGISKLLNELLKEKSRFKDTVFLQDISQSFYSCIANESKYQLISEAFVLYSQNLRSQELGELLTKAGISPVKPVKKDSKNLSAWNWIAKHRNIKKIVENQKDVENETRERLDKLIDDRNNAAHRDIIYTILSVDELVDLCNVVESLCQALAEFAYFAVINRKIAIGQVKRIGKTTNWLSNQKVLYANICQPPLSIGDEIFLLSSTKSYCKSATIEEIRDEEGMPQERIEAIEGVEKRDISVKLDTDACKGLDIYIAALDINEESDIDRY
ncbi:MULTISPECIES: MAE_28990/MAE_18760 family HEPN-like nuclease [Spirulina sp. CCY15215]|uniref:MAE_28990/MAE_18760 family HEPN-like nuclease n=1 Tax=Spirulina sp. CCY15215 TaxID=2767591 RepID=UPI00194F24BF|nr:MAE_28990/MAE_18760 family HEPN-like nuclease [Spirulina major]